MCFKRRILGCGLPWRRAPPLIRKTRAQLRLELSSKETSRAAKRPGQKRPCEDDADPTEDGALQQPRTPSLPEQQQAQELEEDADMMDALDAFSALAGVQSTTTPPPRGYVSLSCAFCHTRELAVWLTPYLPTMICYYGFISLTFLCCD